MLRSIRESRPVTLLMGPRARREEDEPLLEPAMAATPFPTRQILILFLMRFSEPVAALVIFPFISKYIEDLKVTDRPERIGYYAGLIESLFALTMFTTVLSWGRLSDRIGRKPVMLIGLTGSALSVASFGLSRSFLGLVLSRMLGGALNGNVAVIKSMVAEITDSSNQGRAFSYLPLAWSTGSVLAPIIGGSLSNPAKHYPNTFGKLAFFRDNPYFLPCFVAALFPTCGVLIGFFFLEETLTSRAPNRRTIPAKDIASIRGSTPYSTRVSSTVPIPQPLQAEYDTPGTSTPRSDSVDPPSSTPPPSISSLFKNRRVTSCLLVYAILALQTIALDALFVLFSYSSIELGGLAFDESSIGKALALGGAFTVAFQLVVFPPLQKKYGTIKLYRTFMSLYPFVFGLFPIMAKGAAAASSDTGTTIGIWPSLIMFLLFKSIANCSYACNMLAISDSSPSRRLLGSLNGVAQMLSSLMRAFGPLIASSLFAISKERHLVGGDLVWYVMVAFSLAGALATMRLQEGKAEWRVREEAGVE